MNNRYFLEVDYYHEYKYRQLVGGDVFLSRKIKEENRVISVLSDGLGSGVKANVLSTLTSTMASTFISNYIDITRTAEIIMKTLPVCKERKISYSTFSIVDIDEHGDTRIIEYDNPPYLLLRKAQVVDIDKSTRKVEGSSQKKVDVQYSRFQTEKGDRIVLLSDGVSQSGMGMAGTPFGWGMDDVARFAVSLIEQNNDISARELARKIVQRALANDAYRSKDDITCGVIYFRNPRNLLIMSGPPIDKAKDIELAHMVDSFSGQKVICGGTTANIVARELDRKLKVDLSYIDPDIPPPSLMDGVDLVTEGIITLCEASEILKSGDVNRLPERGNAAQRIVHMMLNNDSIQFVVGTKINDVHQDPNMPVELEIRRNIVKKIVKILEEKYLKETKLQFI